MVSELIKKDDNQIVNVDQAVQEWEAYQQLCKRLLDESDYQVYRQKVKGKIVEKQFPKKSAWAKLGRAFNVNTEIVDKEFVLTKTGETKEAYYCIRATLPNGRTVESDGSCSRHEKGKENATSHIIRSTAKTRATNRAISELIGAGEVSADELDPAFTDFANNNSDNEAIEAEFVTAKELKDNTNSSDDELFEDEPAYATAGDVLAYAERNSSNRSADILKIISKLHAPNDLKQQARELLISNSLMARKYKTKLSCKEVLRIAEIGLNLKKAKKTEQNYYKCITKWFKEGTITEEMASDLVAALAECERKNGEFIL